MATKTQQPACPVNTLNAVYNKWYAILILEHCLLAFASIFFVPGAFWAFIFTESGAILLLGMPLVGALAVYAWAGLLVWIRKTHGQPSLIRRNKKTLHTALVMRRFAIVNAIPILLLVVVVIFLFASA